MTLPMVDIADSLEGESSLGAGSLPARLTQTLKLYQLMNLLESLFWTEGTPPL